MKHEPKGREERETAREGTPEPVNKEEQCQQQAKFFATQHVETRHVEKNGTQCFASGSNDNWDNKSAQDESNVIINTDQKGSCLSQRQRISESKII